MCAKNESNYRSCEGRSWPWQRCRASCQPGRGKPIGCRQVAPARGQTPRRWAEGRRRRSLTDRLRQTWTSGRRYEECEIHPSESRCWLPALGTDSTFPCRRVVLPENQSRWCSRDEFIIAKRSFTPSHARLFTACCRHYFCYRKEIQSFFHLRLVRRDRYRYDRFSPYLKRHFDLLFNYIYLSLSDITLALAVVYMLSIILYMVTFLWIIILRNRFTPIL